MSSQSPLVSVVTPSYNQARFLEDTILSVLNQDYPRLEYIIIDGGSTDGSVDIIRKYEDRLAYWVSEPDDGQSDAINKGWLVSRGEILAWLNSDDTYLPSAVSTVAGFLQRHPQVDMVYGYVNVIDEAGRVTWTIEPSTHFDLRRFVHSYFYVPQQTVFFRKCVLDRVGMLDTSLHYCMDPDLWTRVAMHFRVQGIPARIANFRSHSTSKTHDVPLEFVIERYRVAEKYGGEGNTRPAALALVYRWAQLLTRDFGADHREKIDKDWADLPEELSSAFASSRRYVTSEAYLEAAWAHGASGRLAPAVRCFFNAVREDPAVLLRERGILPTIVRASQRFVKTRWRRFARA